MRGGQLRHRVTIQQRAAESSEIDAAGQVVPAWSDVKQVWARVAPISGSEHEHAAAIVGTATHKVTLRYESGLVDHTRRIKYGSRTFDINRADNWQERNIRWECYCTEVV